MQRWSRGVVAALLAGLLMGLSGCAVNPVSGQRELMLLSEGDEIKLGQQTDRDVVRQYGIYEDAELTRYLNDLCRKLGKLSHRPQLDYQLKVLDSPIVNAFAVPGGYLYFSRGILAHMNSEAELVGVLGHEIGHVTARHSAEQYSRAQLAQLGLGVAMVLSETARAFSDVAQFGVQMLFLRFSRDNERQSDELGVEYATRAGYDATQLAGFFGTLERMRDSSDKSGLPSWFSTHPEPGDRRGAVILQTREWQRKLGSAGGEINREGFLRRMEGLVYGEDPRQGYLDGGVFFHPVLRFEFPVPENWAFQNSAGAVLMSSPKKDAALVFSLTSEASPEEAAQAFLQKSRAQVLDSRRGRLNGLEAYGLITRVQTQKSVIGAMSTFIAMDGRVFVFHGFTAAETFDAYRPAFQHTMDRFKPLHDEKRISVRPARIRIRKAPSGGALEQLLKAMGMPQAKLEELALLNGLQLSDPVPAGALLKVLEW